MFPQKYSSDYCQKQNREELVRVKCTITVNECKT